MRDVKFLTERGWVRVIRGNICHVALTSDSHSTLVMRVTRPTLAEY